MALRDSINRADPVADGAIDVSTSWVPRVWVEEDESLETVLRREDVGQRVYRWFACTFAAVQAALLEVEAYEPVETPGYARTEHCRYDVQERKGHLSYTFDLTIEVRYRYTNGEQDSTVGA